MNNKVFIQRKFKCSAATLFDWMIRAELIAQWFGPKNWTVGEVVIEPKTGGKYSIELRNNDKYFFVVGEYKEIKAPHTLVFSLEYRDYHLNPPYSIVNINIRALSENESMLSFIQDFETIPDDFEKRAEAWKYMLQKIGEKV